MSQHEERALILDAADYRESSSLVRLFTEYEGRISLVARGLKRPKGSSSVATIQPFNLVRVRYFMKEGATMGNMAGADLERSSNAARASIDAYAVISYWFDILKQTSQAREAACDIFRLTTEMLRHQEVRPGLSLVFLRQMTLFCQYLGFGMELSRCINCEKRAPAPREFSISRGGIVCIDCAATENRGLPLKPAEAGIVSRLAWSGDSQQRELLVDEGAEVADRDLFEILVMFHRYLTYHIEQPLRTFTFVKATCG